MGKQQEDTGLVQPTGPVVDGDAVDEQGFAEFCESLRAKDEVLHKRLVDGGPRLAQFLHGILGLVTEAAELADAFKKHVAYGKEIDPTNLLEEDGDLRHYLTYIGGYNGHTGTQARTANVRKLRQRYGARFSEHAATHRDTDAEAAAMGHPRPTFDALEKTIAYEYGPEYRAKKRLTRSFAAALEKSTDTHGPPVTPKPHRDVGPWPHKLTTGTLSSDKVTGRGGNGQDAENGDSKKRTIRNENIRLTVQARKKPVTYRYVILTGYTEVDLAAAVNLFISMNPPYWKCAGGPCVTPMGLFAQAMAQARRV